MPPSPAPIPKSPEHWRELAAKLEEFRDRYSEENDAFIWAYNALTDEKIGIIRDSETGTGNRQIWTGIDDYELKKRYETDRDLYDEFLVRYLRMKKPEQFDSPQAYDAWNVAMEGHVAYNCSNSISVRYKIEFGSYRQFDEKSWEYRKNKRKLYAQHRLVAARMEKSNQTTIERVFQGIERMKNGHPPQKTAAPQKYLMAVAPLEIKIPAMDNDAVTTRVAAIKANSYDDITGFGRDLQSEVAKALTDISDYFIQHSARPAQTLDRVEQIMQANNEINPSALLPAMPRSAFNRAAGRIFGVRLVKPEDMPFAQIVEMARDLPQRADEDDKFFSQDLKIVDHAIKICTAYADVIARSAEAFEADRDRLVPETDDSKPLAAELGTSFIPEMFDQRVTELKVSAQFLTQQAARFGNIGRTIGHTRNQLGRMAALSHTVQIPAIDAIQSFNLYQLRRLSAFGRKVDQSVLDQLKLNEQATAEITGSSENLVLGSLDSAQAKLNETFAALSGLLTGDMSAQKDLAREINDETVKHLLHSEAPSPKQG